MAGTGRRTANDSPPSCRKSHGRGAVRDGARTKPDTFIARPLACIPGRRSPGPRPVGCFMEAATLPRSRGPPVTSCISWLLVQWAPADRGPVPKNAEEDIPRVPVRRDHPFAADHWRRGGTARPLPHSRREGAPEGVPTERFQGARQQLRTQWDSRHSGLRYGIQPVDRSRIRQCRMVRHDVTTVLRQRVHALALGYERSERIRRLSR